MKKMPAEGKEFAAPDYADLQHALCGLYTREVAPVEAQLKYGTVGTASYYYHARNDVGNDTNPGGELNLLGGSVAALPDSDRSFVFSVNGPNLDRAYVFAAESAEDMATWIKQIRAHASGRPQVPTATPVPSEPNIQVPSEPVQAELAPAEAVAEAADDDGPGDAGGGEVRMSITGASGEETTVDGLIV